MKQKLLYIIMYIATLAWSIGAWGQKTGYKVVTETKTTILSGTELQSMAGNNGCTKDNVNFKIDGNCSYESNGSCLNIGSTKYDAFTRNVTMTAQGIYTLSSVTSMTVRAVGYASSGLYARYMTIEGGSETNITDSSTNPQRSDGNYTDVSSSNVTTPITITCRGTNRTFASSHPFHINKVTITYKLSHEEEILHTVTIVNGTTSSATAGVDTQGTATANDPASGYEFLGWDYPSSVTLATGYSSTDKTIKFNATNNATITARYGRIYDVTVANNVDATTSTVQAGTIKTATVTASDKTNYEFYQWNVPNGVGLTSGTTISNKTITIQATAENKTITAIYKPVFLFSPTAVSSNETLGTATVSVTNRVVGNVGATSYTTTATFTAEPKTDCVFLGWFTTDSYTGNPISTDLSHTETLTSSIGTAGTKTLYALFKKKQNLQWVDEDMDLNLVLGATGLSSAASVTSIKTITYTSSNENALTIAADGSITTVGLGSSTVTASVPGDSTYIAETITRDFNVGERKQATFTPSWGEATNPSLELGESATISLINVNENFTVTKEGNSISWERTNSNTITISALSAGTTTLTLSQPGDGVYLDGNTTPYTINVIKHSNTFAIAAESKAMKVGEEWTNVVTNTGNNNTAVSYSKKGVATYDAENNIITAVGEGSTTITFTQAETTEYSGATKTIDVTVTKVTNTLYISLPSLTVDVDGTITPSIAGGSQNNTTTPIEATIIDQLLTPSLVNIASNRVIVFEDGVIKAKNAGTAKITFSQPATDQYTASQSYSFDITVSKISNTIVVLLDGEQKNSQNVARDDKVTLSYSSVSDGDYHVSLTSGSTAIATISGNTITAGNTTDGTNIWTIRQDETYKYKAAETTFRIQVNSVAKEDSYLHESLLNGNNYSWYTGLGNDYEVSVDYIPQELRFKAWYDNWAGVNESVTVVWKDEQGNQLGSQKFNLNRDQNEIHYVRNLPEGARKFSFSSTGDFYQYLSDVYVVRKTYINASCNISDLGTIYTDQTGTATISVEWGSSNGGDIAIEEMNNNPRFSFSPNPITGTANSNGSRDVIVTYTPDPDHLGTEEAAIKVYDLFHSQTISISATAQKYTTTIARGNNTATATTVEGSISNAFAFTGTSADYPSADSNADFYYTISHTQTSPVNNGSGVISYNPENNTVTGLNAGTARLTIYQKKTNLYNATSQTFDFTVSKLENKTVMALSTKTVNVDGTATVELMNADSDGALSASYSNISYLNESQNREGGLLTFAGNTLTGWNAGTGTVTITQAETYKYVAKSQSFNVTVNKLPQTLIWDNSSLETTMQVGSTLEGNTATSVVGLTPVTYSSGNTAAITVDANTGVLTAVATGSNVGITASQAGNYKYLPATLTRQFSVFNKQTPAFAADTHFTGANGRVEYTGTATIMVTGVGADNEQGFTITNGDNSVISVVRDGETITITGLQVGSTTLTLAQEGNDDFIAKSQTYNIEVYWPDDFLALSSTVEPTHTAGTYRKVFVNNTLKSGYSTIALPFNTTVETLTGREANPNDWVAQLSVVTYNAKDGYSLYFEKKNTIEANQPYILHLGTAVDSPVFTDVSVVAAEEATQNATNGVHVTDWTMHSNYDPAFDMEGKYGVVNDGAVLKKGTANSTLKALHAYIEGPASAEVKAAYLDEDEADGILELINNQENQSGDQLIYDLQGRRLPRAQAGINIVIRDGKVRKEIEPRR